jgi:hypothetical protein
MLRTVVGVYRNGHIELAETPENVHEETQVIVTFLNPAVINLPIHGIDAVQAAELRARLSTFAEDWDSPAMDIYDDYDTAKAQLQEG